MRSMDALRILIPISRILRRDSMKKAAPLLKLFAVSKTVQHACERTATFVSLMRKLRTPPRNQSAKTLDFDYARLKTRLINAAVLGVSLTTCWSGPVKKVQAWLKQVTRNPSMSITILLFVLRKSLTNRRILS